MFTYQCGNLAWPDSATIGFNAPPYVAYTHPLSTTSTSANIRTDEVACLHEGLSNLIFDLEENNHILEMTPEPSFGIGIIFYINYIYI